jgi:hypothetical protein
MKAKLAVGVVVVIVFAILGVYLVAKRVQVYTATGTISADIGVRDIIRDRQHCKEYFRSKDGRVVKTVCPTAP